MENAKKMLLVEPSFIERLKQQTNVENPMSRLDVEMQKILNSNIEDRKKCILYLQILQRYLHFTEEERQPILLPIITDSINENKSYKNKDIENENLMSFKTPTDDVTEKENNQPRYTTTQILSLIPKSYLKKGELLLNSISLSKNAIYWDHADGTVLINNEKIPGSNIVDLINDTLRPLKKSDPIGWEKFAKTLHAIKIPLTYIGNSKRSDFIHQLQMKSLEGNFTSNEGTLKTPQGSDDKYIKKFKKKIDWEKWTPY